MAGRVAGAVKLAAEFVNRNPRSLERIRIGYKPDGYHLERPGRRYWHKLEVGTTRGKIVARVIHFDNGVVIQASSGEPGIEKQLYRPTDRSAYVNVARVLARRCLQSGINEVSCFFEAEPDTKLDSLIQTLKESGIELSEPPRYKKPEPWDQFRPEKPWEVTD